MPETNNLSPILINNRFVIFVKYIGEGIKTLSQCGKKFTQTGN